MDQELIKFLRRSKDVVGYLSPVIKDQFGNIISGLHRMYADANWPTVTREVRDDLEREVLAINYNIQRTVSREETQSRLLRVAKLLESQGVEKSRICAMLPKITSLDDGYVRELMPDEYKMMSKAREFALLTAQEVPRGWELEYFNVPMTPERCRLVRRAVSTAKKEWGLEDDGEALSMICEHYLEGKEQ